MFFEYLFTPISNIVMSSQGFSLSVFLEGDSSPFSPELGCSYQLGDEVEVRKLMA